MSQLIGTKDFQKLALPQTAANAVSGVLEEKRAFQTYASELVRLMKYASREDIGPDIRKQYEAIATIHGLLKKEAPGSKQRGLDGGNQPHHQRGGGVQIES